MNVIEVTDALMHVGNPDSHISTAQGQDSQSMKKKLAAIDAVLTDDDIFVEVTEKDCGCIDGRCSHVVIYHDDTGAITEHEKDATALTRHNRAKVAGGGYITSTAMDVAVHGPASDIEANLMHAATLLTQSEIVCGAHIGDHQDDAKTDCGANDKMLPIYDRVCSNKSAMVHNMKAAFGAFCIEYSQELCDTVFTHWQEALDTAQYVASDNPVQRMATIRDKIIPQAQEKLGQEGHPAGVIYKLKGDHNELFVLLNGRENLTLSQRVLANKLGQALDIKAEDAPKGFCVDIWRVQQLAQAYAEHTPLALHAGMLYQLGTKAQLTDGTLKVYVAA